MVKLLILLLILVSCAQENKPTTPKDPKNGSVVFSDSDFESEVKNLSDQDLQKKQANLTKSSKELELNTCAEERFHYKCLNDHINIFYYGKQKAFRSHC